MKKLIAIVVLVLFVTHDLFSQSSTGQTYCNPINISYRFCIDQPSRREAADPSVVWFRDRYFLFASKSGGYWHSFDLVNWTFVKIDQQLPTEDYAPTAVALNDTLYFLASSSDFTSIYKSGDPLAAKWSVASPKLPMRVWDPCLFLDDDKRLYLYWGCSDVNPTMGVELDYKNNFAVIGTQKNLILADPAVRGWEVMGDYNTLYDKKTWFEGSWMNKYNGKYYLQYAAPGTEYKCYADGYYVSNSPLGPFTYATNNPFSSKPEGYIAGAGHGSSFSDKYGNWWHISTFSISVKHMFERRLGLFPVTFDAQGNMAAHSEFGDLPMMMPDHKYTDVSELFPSWMMLSYKKTGEASSSLATNPISYAFDENVRDYWSAATGNAGEWLSVDLATIDTVRAVQINFAENNTQLYGRNGIQAQQYLLQYSTDKKTWIKLADKTTNTEDLTHQYHALSTPVLARYLRVVNYRVPGGTFAVSGFRVFGSAAGSKPTKVTSFNYTRDAYDSRNITLKWNKQKNATGYMIRFGVAKDKLYRSYQVYSDTTVTIHSLDKGTRYWFVIDAFGESGITPGDVQEGVITSACPTTAYISINNEPLQQISTVTINSGKAVTFSPQPADGTWSWTGPYGFTATTREIVFNSFDAGMAGTYFATYTSSSGCKSLLSFAVTVNGSNGCTTAAPIIPYMQANTDGWQQMNKVTLAAGGTVTFGPQPVDGTWRWAGPNGFTATSREIKITNVQIAQAGLYKASYTNASGCASVMTFTVSLPKTAAGINDATIVQAAEVYPNPAHNQLIFRNVPMANTPIIVFNPNGQAQLKTISKSDLSETTVDISSLKPGAYYMKIGNTRTVKFLKQ